MASPRSGQPPVASDTLSGRRVLVVEDNFLLAIDVGDMLAAAGAEALGPASSLRDAFYLLATQVGQIDAALLDVDLHGEMVWPLVDALIYRNVPVALCTAYDVTDIPWPYGYLPRCEKPASDRAIVAALTGIVRRLDDEQSGQA